MFQEEYKQKSFYWGLKPNPVLEKFINIIPKGKALDIGAGEGRNSIFLAQHDFAVEALDKIPEGLEKCQNLAKETGLHINTIVQDVRNFDFQKEKYSLILAVASLDFLKKTEIEIIFNKIKKSLVENGFIFLSVFSTNDPLFRKLKERSFKEIEENTFFMPKIDTIRHFFTRKEITEAFNTFEVVYTEEKDIEDKSHDQPHFHSIIEFLARKMR
jgi:cyclopropane fatty-acyl-phospholipid synthase-like methyltransferase